MTHSILWIALLILMSSTFLYPLIIRGAHRYGLLDHPSPRRRHRMPTPIAGGLGIFFSWSVGIAIICKWNPEWSASHMASLLPIGISLGILICVGLLDDVYGLSPTPKLVFQLLAAGIVVLFEPNLNALCLIWRESVGILVWPAVLLWIVGMTNAVNLIDGLDGLAGGTALLVSSSIAVLGFFTRGIDSFQTVSMTLLAISILGFLRFNWAPAKIFLGDNGSLPLGFLIAISSLTCHPASRSWIKLSSVVLMLGYPVLDMGFAVFRRAWYGLPLFKADRNHLHFRLQRLGLSVPQAAVFLLSIGVYLQLTSLSLNLLPEAVVLPAMALVVFSILSILYVIRCIEVSRVKEISIKCQNSGNYFPELKLVKNDFTEPTGKPLASRKMSVNVRLGPIFEVGLHEEKLRYNELVGALKYVLTATAGINEEIIVTRDSIQILMSVHSTNPRFESEKLIRKKYEDKLSKFCALYDLQCSMSTIPLTVKSLN